MTVIAHHQRARADPAPRYRRGRPAGRRGLRPGTRFLSMRRARYLRAPRRPDRQSFFKSLLRLGILLRMHRPGCNRVRPSSSSHLPIVLSCTSTDQRRATSACRSMHRQRTTLCVCGSGPRMTSARSSALLRRAQIRLPARASARLQPGNALGIVAMHPVGQRLAIHAAQGRRLGPRTPLKDQRNRQNAANPARHPCSARTTPEALPAVCSTRVILTPVPMKLSAARIGAPRHRVTVQRAWESPSESRATRVGITSCWNRDAVIETKGYRGTYVHPGAKANCKINLQEWTLRKLGETVAECARRGVTDSEIRNAFAGTISRHPSTK